MTKKMSRAEYDRLQTAKLDLIRAYLQSAAILSVRAQDEDMDNQADTLQDILSYIQRAILLRDELNKDIVS